MRWGFFRAKAFNEEGTALQVLLTTDSVVLLNEDSSSLQKVIALRKIAHVRTWFMHISPAPKTQTQVDLVLRGEPAREYALAFEDVRQMMDFADALMSVLLVIYDHLKPLGAVKSAVTSCSKGDEDGILALTRESLIWRSFNPDKIETLTIPLEKISKVSGPTVGWLLVGGGEDVLHIHFLDASGPRSQTQEVQIRFPGFRVDPKEWELAIAERKLAHAEASGGAKPESPYSREDAEHPLWRIASGTCWFCGRGQPVPELAHGITLYRDSGQTKPLKVPRCRYCAAVHQNEQKSSNLLAAEALISFVAALILWWAIGHFWLIALIWVILLAVFAALTSASADKKKQQLDRGRERTDSPTEVKGVDAAMQDYFDENTWDEGWFAKRDFDLLRGFSLESQRKTVQDLRQTWGTLYRCIRCSSYFRSGVKDDTNLCPFCAVKAKLKGEQVQGLRYEDTPAAKIEHEIIQFERMRELARPPDD